jgi:hypothetical protein
MPSCQGVEWTGCSGKAWLCPPLAGRETLFVLLQDRTLLMASGVWMTVTLAQKPSYFTGKGSLRSSRNLFREMVCFTITDNDLAHGEERACRSGWEENASHFCLSPGSPTARESLGVFFVINSSWEGKWLYQHSLGNFPLSPLAHTHPIREPQQGKLSKCFIWLSGLHPRKTLQCYWEAKRAEVLVKSSGYPFGTNGLYTIRSVKRPLCTEKVNLGVSSCSVQM